MAKKGRKKRATNPGGSKEKGARFPLSYINPELKAALVKKAEEKGISAAAYTLDLIERAVK